MLIIQLEDESPADDNPALNTAQKALSILTQEQRAVLSRVLEGFVAYLAPSSGHRANPATRSVITIHSWNNRANWERDEWAAWETWGWYRHFCRAVCVFFLLNLILMRRSIHLISEII